MRRLEILPLHTLDDKDLKQAVKADVMQDKTLVKDIKVLTMRKDVSNTASAELLPPQALKKSLAAGTVAGKGAAPTPSPRDVETSAKKEDGKGAAPTPSPRDVKDKKEVKSEIKEIKADLKDEKKDIEVIDTKFEVKEDKVKELKEELKDEKKVLKSLKKAEDAVKDKDSASKAVTGKIVLHTEKAVLDLDTESGRGPAASAALMAGCS